MTPSDFLPQPPIPWLSVFACFAAILVLAILSFPAAKHNFNQFTIGAALVLVLFLGGYGIGSSEAGTRTLQSENPPPAPSPNNPALRDDLPQELVLRPGKEVTTTPLLADRVYELTISGVYRFEGDTYLSPFPADAFHYATDRYVRDWLPYDALTLDGKLIRQWPHRSVSCDKKRHRYSFQIDGTGRPLAIALCRRTALVVEHETHQVQPKGELLATILLLPKETVSLRAEEGARHAAELEREAAEAQKREQQERRRLEHERERAAARSAWVEQRQAEMEQHERQARREREARERVEARTRQLDLTTSHRRNWAHEAYRQSYARAHTAELIAHKADIVAAHAELYRKEGPDFMTFMEQRYPDLFRRLTGKYETLLLAERLHESKLARDADRPRRPKLTKEQWRQRDIQRLETHAGDLMARKQKAHELRERFRAMLQRRGLTEEEIERQLELWDTEIAAHLEGREGTDDRSTPVKVIK